MSTEEKKKKDREYAKEWRRKNPHKIKAYLERTKEHRKKVNDEWLKNNKDKIKKANQRAYKKNKQKWTSRVRTRELIKLENITLFNKCGHPKNLEIHHETYPLKKDDIRKAIENKEIYHLCRKCHTKKHKNKLNERCASLETTK